MRALSIVLLLCVLVTGCAPSLRPAPGAPTATPDECAEIDSSQSTWGSVTTWILVIAGSVGIAGVFLAESNEAKIATGSIASVGAYSGALTYGRQQANVREYTDKKCAAHASSAP